MQLFIGSYIFQLVDAGLFDSISSSFALTEFTLPDEISFNWQTEIYEPHNIWKKTGLSSSATAELRLKYFSITLKKESHVIGLLRKELVFGQIQKKWSKFKGTQSRL